MVGGSVVALAALAASVVLAAGQPGSLYRPPPVSPVVTPGSPGEGVWRGAGTPIAGSSPVLVTTFRPEVGDTSVVAYLAWIDHTRTQLALYPGSTQPPNAVPRGPTQIPFGERWRLLATFNGGFKYGSRSSGGGGFAVNGHTYVPLERGLGTVVGYRSGRIDVIAWNGARSPGGNVAFARQNLNLLVSGGRRGADLTSPAVWGWTLGGGEIVWRTGVGIDRWGNLLYAAADETVAGLARILIRAGAVRAIELDINPEWPTFDVYTHMPLQPVRFLPNYQEPVSRYLVPDSRDFFAVYRRIPGVPVTVPFR
jgi:Phosphodiester glycosidase